MVAERREAGAPSTSNRASTPLPVPSSGREWARGVVLDGVALM